MKGRIFTIDVEDWHHSNLKGAGPTVPKTTVLPEAMPLILDLLARHSVSATFFILVDVLPRLQPFIKQMIAAGHEIASHGISHEMATSLDAKGFEKEAAESKKHLEDAFGVKVRGFRAPSWSINRENCGFCKILEQCGYRYDASVFPIRTFLYGFPEAPRGPFRIRIGKEVLSLVNVPCSTVDFLGRAIAFSGGFYLRALPSFLIQRFSRTLWETDCPVIYYLHPRELLTIQPIPDLGFRDRLIHTYGLSTTIGKAGRILSQGGFSTLSEYVAALDPEELPIHPCTGNDSLSG